MEPIILEKPKLTAKKVSDKESVKKVIIESKAIEKKKDSLPSSNDQRFEDV